MLLLLDERVHLGVVFLQGCNALQRQRRHATQPPPLQSFLALNATLRPSLQAPHHCCRHGQRATTSRGRKRAPQRRWRTYGHFCAWGAGFYRSDDLRCWVRQLTGTTRRYTCA
jgi:hypothetical protein